MGRTPGSSGSPSAGEGCRQLGGKYLTFELASEQYGLEILKVREIIGLMDITPVPCTPPSVKGVINLRGKVIPVVDLRLKFGMEGAEATDQTCIIVVDVGEIEMGILVDKVSEVLDIASEEIEDTPAFGVSVKTDFILGMGKAGKGVTILLDIGKVITASEAAPLAGLPEPAARRDE
ncbi:MAG: chemotaxis protein CheW [Planctomycetota bacterium]